MDSTQDIRSHLKQDCTQPICLFCKAPVIFEEFEPRFQASVHCGKSSHPKKICGRCEFQKRAAPNSFSKLIPVFSGSSSGDIDFPVLAAGTNPPIFANSEKRKNHKPAPVRDTSLHSESNKVLRSTNFSDWRKFRDSNVSSNDTEVSPHVELMCLLSALTETK